jgi:POT family proton-dependent oligopeptide transporter
MAQLTSKQSLDRQPLRKKASTVVSHAASSIRQGREVPTVEDFNTLRRISGKVPWTAYTIAFVELCERFSYYGTTAVCMSRAIDYWLSRNPS